MSNPKDDDPIGIVKHSYGESVVIQPLANRCIGLFLGMTLLSFSVGCSMCAGPFDCHYAAYGGSTPRTDMINGRVGSAFNDAGVLQAAPIDQYIESEPFYQDSTVPMESTEPFIINDGQILDPAAETIIDEGYPIPLSEGNEWVPDVNGEYQSGEITNETISAPTESYEMVPAVPQTPLDDALYMPEGSSSR